MSPAFKEKTGCPVLLSTSFNVRDEPVVCAPEDTFPPLHGLRPGCVAHCHYLEEADQDPNFGLDYKDAFELDQACNGDDCFAAATRLPIVIGRGCRLKRRAASPCPGEP